jgi:hypothetical protein
LVCFIFGEEVVVEEGVVIILYLLLIALVIRKPFVTVFLLGQCHAKVLLPFLCLTQDFLLTLLGLIWILLGGLLLFLLPFLLLFLALSFLLVEFNFVFDLLTVVIGFLIVLHLLQLCVDLVVSDLAALLHL